MAEKQKTKEKKVENQDQCGWIGGQLEDLKNRIHRLHFRKTINVLGQYFRVANTTPCIAWRKVTPTRPRSKHGEIM